MVAIVEGTTYDPGYKNATDTSGGGWAVTDRIFGYLDRAGGIYNDIRYPQVGDPDYNEYEARQRMMNAGMLGLPRPWGGVILIAGAAFLVWGVYAMTIKQ